MDSHRPLGGRLNPVSKYLETVENPRFQEALIELRELIREELISADECISYGIPTFKISGKNIVHFAAFKNHCSFFPGGIAEDYANRLPNHKISKGTIQFTPDNPIPEDVLRDLLRHSLTRNS